MPRRSRLSDGEQQKNSAITPIFYFVLSLMAVVTIFFQFSVALPLLESHTNFFVAL
jgi:hypothetical protein